MREAIQRAKAQRANEIHQLGGRVMPQDTEVEELVLSSMLNDPTGRLAILEVIPSEEVFYKEEHQKLFSAILACHEEGAGVDIVRVAQRLKKTDDFLAMGGSKYIAQISGKTSYVANVEVHARIILECWMKRCIIESATSLIRGCYDDSTDVFEVLDDAERLISEKTGQILKSSDQSFAQIADHEAELVEKAETGQIAGASTGLHELDTRISGLCQPDMIIVAARPGAGKSSLAFSIMSSMASKGIPVGLITLEMSKGQVFNRMNSMNSGVWASKIRNRNMDEAEKRQFFKWVKIMRAWPIHINETANTLSKLRVKATMWKNKHGIKALFIDYLQLMSGEGKRGQSRENEVSDISRGLKQLAKTLEIPVIALSQLSRKVEERTSKMPQLSDLRESGSIEQDADFVLFLMRPEYYKMDGTFNIGGNEIHSDGLCIGDLAKSRHSATGEFAMRFVGPTMHFVNHESTAIPPTTQSISTDGRVAAFEEEKSSEPF